MSMVVTFWGLCALTLVVALGLAWVGFRVVGLDLGLKGFGAEVGTLLVVSGLQGLLLFTVYGLVHWTHWLQHLVAGLVAVLAYKATHVTEMDEYQHVVIAAAQLGLLWVAVKLAPYSGF